MRKRNIKVNVFLNEEEKKMLEEKSKNTKLSQSVFIRNLIKQYYATQPTKDELSAIKISLVKIIDNLSLLKRQMDFLRYSDYSNFISKQINQILDITSKISK